MMSARRSLFTSPAAMNCFIDPPAGAQLASGVEEPVVGGRQRVGVQHAGAGPREDVAVRRPTEVRTSLPTPGCAGRSRGNRQPTSFGDSADAGDLDVAGDGSTAETDHTVSPALSGSGSSRYSRRSAAVGVADRPACQRCQPRSSPAAGRRPACGRRGWPRCRVIVVKTIEPSARPIGSRASGGSRHWRLLARGGVDQRQETTGRDVDGDDRRAGQAPGVSNQSAVTSPAELGTRVRGCVAVLTGNVYRPVDTSVSAQVERLGDDALTVGREGRLVEHRAGGGGDRPQQAPSEALPHGDRRHLRPARRPRRGGRSPRRPGVAGGRGPGGGGRPVGVLLPDPAVPGEEDVGVAHAVAGAHRPPAGRSWGCGSSRSCRRRRRRTRYATDPSGLWVLSS